jgi:beta-lactamase regulating signal transducer with metallopeptidase domain
MLSLIHSNAVVLIVDAALQSFIILAVAGGVGLCLRRASAATRHWVWFLSVACLPLLPLFSSLLPAWQKPMWSLSAGSGIGNQFSIALEFAPVTPAKTHVRKESVANGALATAPPADRRQLAAQFNANWAVFAFFVWLGGTLLALGSVLMGQWRVRQLKQRSQVLRDSDWTELLRELRGQLRIRRSVTLLQCADSVMPGTWGTRRPTVLLPVEAGQWPPERRRVVLQHELAHVRRWDCATQMITGLVCALYWFNPLAWLAARRMCVERERACDDMVLNIGCKASDYADHLVDIAKSFRPLRATAAIAMARSSALEGRVAAIVDAFRPRGMRPLTAVAVAAWVAGMVLMAGGCKLPTAGGTLHEQQVAHMEKFSKVKEAQAKELAARAGEKISPEFQRFFAAATKGDGPTVVKMDYDIFQKHHPQYQHDPAKDDLSLRTSYWQTVLEICLGYDLVVNCDPAYLQMAINDLLQSIPAGSIYFGGTDPGRGLPTAFCKSHAEGDPFFTLTQNALADSTYLVYLGGMYGGKIYTPSKEDSQTCFGEYIEDATRRLHENKLKPGENVRIDNGQTAISGPIAVMSINALLAKIVFDKNPGREFYIEQSFPLDWMYPHLEPHGPIMKINRQPLPQMPEETLQKDRDYWNKRVAGMIGNWLDEDTAVQTVAEFVDRVYARADLAGFNGDRNFIQNDYAKKIFSKWRSSIAGVYAWRAKNSPSSDEQKRMLKEAEFAYRQAWALCPYSSEAVVQYANLLSGQQKKSDALLVAETAARVAPPNEKASDKAQRNDLIKTLKSP